ncbi:MAG: ribose 5-phosphate isomerase B [Oscillospiraceae bacterium]|nr:ribose 5-phosphate isomerase B [Oscillospiraceae bacterium]
MIVIASDHAGFPLKQELAEHLRAKGVAFEDIGCYSAESVDYPEYAARAARGVADGTYDRGILVCGTGLGMAMAAGKIRGIRCAAVSESYSAEMSRSHNDANMIALGGRVIGPELAKQIVDVFLSTEFLGGKHQRRVDMIGALETE